MESKRPHIALIQALAVILATGGCSRGPDFDAPGTPVPTPHMRAGYWWHSLQVGDYPAKSHQYCDGGRDLAPTRKGDCPVFGFRKTVKGDLIFQGKCSTGAEAETIRYIVHGDVNRDFTSDADGETTLADGQKVYFRGHEAYRYIGPCPPGAVVHGGPGGS